MHIRHAHHLFNDRTFHRGVDYVEWGMVRIKPQMTPHVFDVIVKGTRLYKINIAVDDAGHLLSYQCDCHGHHCKHLAASFIMLAARNYKQYQTSQQLNLVSVQNTHYQDTSTIHEDVILQLSKALSVAKKSENTDALFEGYEYYMETMEWLLQNHFVESALSVFEYMMDDYVSYWSAISVDVEEMNLFAKQTPWIKRIFQSYKVDPRRLLMDMLLYFQLYPEVDDQVLTDWLLILGDLAVEGDFEEDIDLVLKEAKLHIKDVKCLSEIYFVLEMTEALEEEKVFYALEHLESDVCANYAIQYYEFSGQYDEIIRICRQKMKPRPKHEDIPWVLSMLRAYEQKEDNFGMVSTLKWLYYCGDLNAIEHLKRRTDRRQWRDVVNDLINEYHQGAYSDWVYRDLLIKERKHELLLQYTNENPNLISQLHQYLVDDYPDWVYALLLKWIAQIYKQDPTFEAVKPWIRLVSEYFGEDEGWSLVNEYRG